MQRSRTHHIIYVLGLVALTVSLPLSHFAMGLVAFILFLNWLAEWNWKEKWVRIKQNRQGLVFAGLFVACLLGLMQADDCGRALVSLRSKLPLLLLPIVILTSETISKKELSWVIRSFVVSTLFCCIYSLCYAKTHTVTDIREISPFIDHIRFSLCVVMSMVFCINNVIEKYADNCRHAWIPIVAVLFLLVYLFISQTLTGIVILFVLSIVHIFYIVTRKPVGRAQKIVLGLVISCLLGCLIYSSLITIQYFKDKDGEIVSNQTSLGNPYEFDHQSIIENGHRIGYYVCKSELQSAWVMRSDTAYSDILEQTLIRYLNSKGQHKDYAAVMAMSEGDVRNVENKIANYAYTKKFGLRRALYQTFFSLSLYRKNHNIDASSLMQRVELWDASCQVLKNHWILGVGLGDHKIALDDQLQKQGSSIAHRHNRGSHNQYLTFGLMGGILLLTYFLFVMIYPFVRMRSRITWTYLALIVLIAVSCLTEDTLETQTGLMMFALFSPMLLYCEK